jgi:hypothetical protein
VFKTPIEGFEFSNDELLRTFSNGELKAVLDIRGEWDYFDELGNKWLYCRPIQAPQPKTRPMTHFEILKMDAVFKNTRNSNIGNTWNSAYDNTEEHTYCLRSDFQKAETLEDVVWKKLEVEA